MALALCLTSVHAAPTELLAGSNDVDLLARQLSPSPAPGGGETICGMFDGYFPDICSCFDASSAATLQCAVSVDGYLDFGVRIVFDFCSTPDFALSIEYPGTSGYQLYDQFGLPFTETLPIPDLGIYIPGLGEFGAQAEMTVSGSLSDLTFSAGIGGCVDGECDSSLWIIGSYLPINLLQVSGVDMSAVVSEICGYGR